MANSREHDRPENSEGTQNLTVALPLTAYDKLQKLCADRSLSLTEAVRRGLILLALYEDENYEMIRISKDPWRRDEFVSAWITSEEMPK